MHKFNWSLAEVEDMLPFERDIYVSILSAYLAEELQRAQDRAALSGR